MFGTAKLSLPLAGRGGVLLRDLFAVRTDFGPVETLLDYVSFRFTFGSRLGNRFFASSHFH
jgi:hypothetical protein